MADDKNKYEDPDERDDQFDDEDFGLPDLDYDELDEDEDLDIDEPFDEEEIEIEEEPTAKNEPTFGASEEPDFGSGDDDVNFSGGDDDWEKELEKELESELESGDDSPSFYEEESFDEFDSSTEETSSVFGNDSDDYSSSTASTADTYPSEGTTYRATGNPDSSEVPGGGNKGKFVRTVVIGTLLFVVIAILFWVLYPGSASEEEKVTEVKKEKPVEEKKEEPAPVVEEKKEEPAPKKAQPVAKPAGEITKLDAATGKAYVVIGSFFDGDLAEDYAKELSAEGKSPYVIPPFKDYRFYRVAIAEYNSFADAQSDLDTYKAEYGNDIWTLRY